MPDLTLAEPMGLALSWMVTYLIHSTILILGVWLVCRGLKPVAKRIGPGAENLAWKLAIVGGFVTATVQVGAGVTPALGAFEISTAATEVTEASAPAPVVRTAPTLPTIIDDPGEFVMLGVGPSTIAPPSSPATITPPAASEPGPAPVWPFVVLGVWLLGVGIASIRLLVSVRSLRRRLADREEVLVDPVLETFLTLCRDAEVKRKIRLTQSVNIGSPIALWRREIVVPERAVEQLSPAAMRSVLAHELAHLERRDPHWLAFAAALEVLCFFQPLNRLARRGMQESAELLCDDWAIGQTRDAVQFAKSLAELASWTDANRSSPLVAGMLSGERPLVQRVRRALDGDPRRFDTHRAPRPARVLLGLGTLAALIMIAPGAVDASPPHKAAKQDSKETKAERKARKAREKAEKAAAEAEKRADKARLEAAKAKKDADEARLRAEQARRAAEIAAGQPMARPGDRSVGREHLIIRDGDDYIIIDGSGLRLRSDEAEIEIIDGQNPRMRMRIHDGSANIDLDIDLDTIESMTESILGGLIVGGMGDMGMGMEGLGELEALGQMFGGEFEHELGADIEAQMREAEAQMRGAEARMRELERQYREGRSGQPGFGPPAPPAPIQPQVAPPAPPAPIQPQVAPPAPPPAPAPLVSI